MAKMASSDTVLTPVARLSFPVLDKPRAVNEGDTPKFSATLLFDAKAQQTEEFKNLKRAYKQVLKDQFGDDIPKKLKQPFLTKEDLEDPPEGYEDDMIFLRVNSKIQPGLVDEKVQKVLNPAEKFYAGCYVAGAVHAYAWKHPTGGVGISFGLDHLQFYRDGEPFTKRSKPTDVFSAIKTGAGALDDDDDVL
jgi:hypothetical protein